ncbi:MAG: hypothetical protein C0605_17000 [Hyphomicrobiales bacterium]|nr:MAG: hypothetical protein C0605_17000 [Hyphomicrobiales bacterium]
MMAYLLLIGCGAGAVSGLLFASLATGSMPGVLLYLLAPLPLLLAGLGWGSLSGAAAALTATVLVGILLNAKLAFLMLISVVLPAAWLGRLALLSRRGASGEAEFYPPGRLVIWTGLIGAGLACAMLLYANLADLALKAAIQEQITQILNAVIAASPSGQAPDAAQVKALAGRLSVLVLPGWAQLWMIAMLINLWAAGRILRIAGQLRRNWPDIPALDFPARYHFVLPAAMALAFVPGLMGDMALPVAATGLMAYGLMGLAIMHQISRYRDSRPFILTGIYTAIFLLSWPLLILAVIAMGEPVFKLRARLARPENPPDSGT